MKHKIVVVVISLFSLIQASCGSNTDPQPATTRLLKYSELGPPPRDTRLQVALSPAHDADGQTRQFIVTTVDMLCEASNIDSAVHAIQIRVSGVHGLVEKLTVSTSSDSQKNAQLLCLIPSALLTETLTWLPSQVNRVTSQTLEAHDESSRFYDIDAHLRNKKAAEKRIRDVLTIAKTANEILAIEQGLADIRADIEQLESQKHELLKKTEYAHLSLSLVPIPRGTNVEPQTLWGQVVLGFKQGGNSFGDVLAFSIKVIIAGVPAIVLFGVIAWGVRLVVFRRSARGKAPARD